MPNDTAMGKLKDYYNNDFNNCVKVHMRTKVQDVYIYGAICYDFNAFTAFTSFYVSEPGLSSSFFETLLKGLKYGETEFEFNNEVSFPQAKYLPAEYETDGPFNFRLKVKFFGDTDWLDKDQIVSSRRIFIYSETNFTDQEIADLKQYASEQGHNLQFRSTVFAARRTEREFTLGLN